MKSTIQDALKSAEALFLSWKPSGISVEEYLRNPAPSSLPLSEAAREFRLRLAAYCSQRHGL